MGFFRFRPSFGAVPDFSAAPAEAFDCFHSFRSRRPGIVFFCFFFNRDPIGAKPPSPVPPSLVYFLHYFTRWDRQVPFMYHVCSLPTDQSTLPGTKQKKNTRLPVEVGWLFYTLKSLLRGAAAEWG